MQSVTSMLPQVGHENVASCAAHLSSSARTDTARYAAIAIIDKVNTRRLAREPRDSRCIVVSRWTVCDGDLVDNDVDTIVNEENQHQIHCHFAPVNLGCTPHSTKR